jgi:Protein of unknown function (DUF3768)
MGKGVYRERDCKIVTAIMPGIFSISSGIAALGQEAVDRIVKTIAVFDDFCHANDPYEEHDFGSFEAEAGGLSL